jgi:hypothetical protein
LDSAPEKPPPLQHCPFLFFFVHHHSELHPLAHFSLALALSLANKRSVGMLTSRRGLCLVVLVLFVGASIVHCADGTQLQQQREQQPSPFPTTSTSALSSSTRTATSSSAGSKSATLSSYEPFGRIKFVSSCGGPDQRRRLNDGIALLHSFWYEEVSSFSSI